MLMTLERFDGTTLAGWSPRAELLMTPTGTRRHNVSGPSAAALSVKTDCDALTGCPTAASVAAACSSVCEVVVGGADAKLGATDGAMLALTGRRHLSSVISSVGRQIDKM